MTAIKQTIHDSVNEENGIITIFLTTDLQISFN